MRLFAMRVVLATLIVATANIIAESESRPATHTPPPSALPTHVRAAPNDLHPVLKRLPPSARVVSEVHSTRDADGNVTAHTHVVYPEGMALAPAATSVPSVLAAHPELRGQLACDAAGTLRVPRAAAPLLFSAVAGEPVAAVALVGRLLVGLRSAVPSCPGRLELARVAAATLDRRHGDGAYVLGLDRANPHEVHAVSRHADDGNSAPSGAAATLQPFMSAVSHRVLREHEAAALVQRARDAAVARGDTLTDPPPMAGYYNRTRPAAAAASAPRGQATAFDRTMKAQAAYIDVTTTVSSITAGRYLTVNFWSNCGQHRTTWLKYNINDKEHKWELSSANWHTSETGSVTFKLPSIKVDQTVTFYIGSDDCDESGWWDKDFWRGTTIFVQSNVLAFMGTINTAVLADKEYTWPLTWSNCGSLPTIRFYRDVSMNTDTLLSTIDLTVHHFNAHQTQATFKTPPGIDTIAKAYIEVSGNCGGDGAGFETPRFEIIGTGDPVAFLGPSTHSNVFPGKPVTVTWQAGLALSGSAKLSLWEHIPAWPDNQIGSTVYLSQTDFDKGKYTWTPSRSDMPSSTEAGFFYFEYTPSGSSERTRTGFDIALVGTDVSVAEFTTPAANGIFARTAQLPVALRWGGGGSDDGSAMLDLYQYGWVYGSTKIGSTSFDMSSRNPSRTVDLATAFPQLATTATMNPAFYLEVTGFDCWDLVLWDWCNSAESPLFYLSDTRTLPAGAEAKVSFSCDADCKRTPKPSLCTACLNKGVAVTTLDASLFARNDAEVQLSFNRYWWTVSPLSASLGEYSLDGSAEMDGTVVVGAEALFKGKFSMPVPPWPIVGFAKPPSFSFLTYRIALDMSVRIEPSLVLDLVANANVSATVPIRRRVTVSTNNMGTGASQGLTTSEPGVSAMASAIKLQASGSVELRPQLSLRPVVSVTAGPVGDEAWVGVTASATAYVNLTLKAQYPPLAPRTTSNTAAIIPFGRVACASRHLMEVTAAANVVNIGGSFSAPGMDTKTLALPNVPTVTLLDGCMFARGGSAAAVVPAFTLQLTAAMTSDFVAKAFLEAAIAERLSRPRSDVSIVVPSGGGTSQRRLAAASVASADVYVMSTSAAGVPASTFPSDGLSLLQGQMATVPGESAAVPIGPPAAATTAAATMASGTTTAAPSTTTAPPPPPSSSSDVPSPGTAMVPSPVSNATTTSAIIMTTNTAIATTAVPVVTGSTPPPSKTTAAIPTPPATLPTAPVTPATPGSATAPPASPTGTQQAGYPPAAADDDGRVLGMTTISLGAAGIAIAVVAIGLVALVLIKRKSKRTESAQPVAQELLVIQRRDAEPRANSIAQEPEADTDDCL